MPKFWAWSMGLHNVQPNDANTKKVGGFALSSPSNQKASTSENKAENWPIFRTNPSHRTIITFKTWKTRHLCPLWELPCPINFQVTCGNTGAYAISLLWLAIPIGYLMIYIILNKWKSHFVIIISPNDIHIQSSAVIMRSKIIRYCINDCRNWGRISIRCWIHKRHPISRPNGRAMGCLLWIFLRTLTAL